jgi:DedD protein
LDERIKERLTGAAILVVIVVVLVPEMFRGERAASPSPVQSEPGTPPLRSYTIELDGMSAASAAQPAAAEPSASVAPVVVPAPTPAQPAVAAAPHPSPPASSASPASTASTARTASEKPAPERTGGEWVVQVATFSQRENAARMVQQAAKKGARLMVAGPDGRGMYRVRSTPQSSRQAAASLQARLKAQGYSGMVSAAN